MEQVVALINTDSVINEQITEMVTQFEGQSDATKIAIAKTLLVREKRLQHVLEITKNMGMDDQDQIEELTNECSRYKNERDEYQFKHTEYTKKYGKIDSAYVNKVLTLPISNKPIDDRVNKYCNKLNKYLGLPTNTKLYYKDTK